MERKNSRKVVAGILLGSVLAGQVSLGASRAEAFVSPVPVEWVNKMAKKAIRVVVRHKDEIGAGGGCGGWVRLADPSSGGGGWRGEPVRG